MSPADSADGPKHQFAGSQRYVRSRGEADMPGQLADAFDPHVRHLRVLSVRPLLSVA